MYGKKNRSVKPSALCIQPPVYDFALYDLFFKPYGLLRIASWLQQAGYAVELLNALDYRDPDTVAALGPVKRKADGTGKFHRRRVELPPHIHRIGRSYGRYGILPEVLERRIRNARPDVVMITSQMTYWYQGVVETVNLVKKHHPGIPVLVGGVYATLLPEHCREVTGADCVVQGDGFDMLPGILGSCDLPVPGPAGEDPVPITAAEIWNDAGVLRLNRGCPYRCTYCASGLIEPHFRKGDPERLLETVKEMHRTLGIRNFAFYDDALLVDRERVLLPLLEEVVRQELDLRFYTPNAVHMHHLDGETAELMKKAGFQEIRLGYESADDQFHRDMDGKYTPDEVPRALSALKKAGFRADQILLYVLAGLPGQSVGEVERTLDKAEGFGVRVSIAEYSPVPRTALWEKAVREAYLPIDEEPLYHNNSYFPMEGENFTRADLERVKETARSFGRG